MCPQLEQLECRDMMDAALANSYLTQLAPLMGQFVQAQEVHVYYEASTIIAMATAQTALLGPSIAARQLPVLAAQAEALLTQLPTLQMAAMSLQADTYRLLLDLPPSSLDGVIASETASYAEQLTGMMPI